MTPQQAANVAHSRPFAEVAADVHCGGWEEILERVWCFGGTPTLRTEPRDETRGEMIRAAEADRVARALERYCEARGLTRAVTYGAEYRFPEPCGDGVFPLTIDEASGFVDRHHRHHEPLKIPSHRKLALGLRSGGRLVGVAVLGNPAARRLCDGQTIEVRRLAVLDGVRNGASLLLGACARVAREWGYRRIVTYTLPEEGGASLRGAGWECDGVAGGGTWDRADRRRDDQAPTTRKVRWSRWLAPPVKQVQLLEEATSA